LMLFRRKIVLFIQNKKVQGDESLNFRKTGQVPYKLS